MRTFIVTRRTGEPQIVVCDGLQFHPTHILFMSLPDTIILALHADEVLEIVTDLES